MKQQRVRRLALSYLAVIMTLSLVFSVIIYIVTAAQLNRPLPPGEHSQQPPKRRTSVRSSLGAAQPRDARVGDYVASGT
jgi:pneumovirus attachment glycoprotein G